MNFIIRILRDFNIHNNIFCPLLNIKQLSGCIIKYVYFIYTIGILSNYTILIEGVTKKWNNFL